MNFGFVYVLGNVAMPGVYVVGKTEGSPTAAARALSQCDAAALPFELLCFGEVEDIDTTVRGIHDDYANTRLTPSKEFFRTRLIDIVSTIDLRSLNFHVTEAGQAHINAEPDAARAIVPSARPTVLLGETGSWPTH